jgi:hypothetical protein
MTIRFVLLRCLGLGAVLSCALLVAATTAQAQSSGTATIMGTVTDESKAALPGVTVTAGSPALQTRQLTAVTASDGTYRFTTLPPGVYDLAFELSGFQKVSRQELRLVSGFVATINMEMKIGTLSETLTIVGESPVVDVKTTSGQTNFTKEMLETAPVSRTMWQVFSMSPGVRVSSAPDVGGNSTGNQQSYSAYGVSGQNTPMIEGLNTREGTDSAGFFYDYGAFEEVQVRALGNVAEVATPGTNFVGIVKSGGNEFHGRYVAQGQTKGLQGDNIDDELRAAGITQGDKLEYFYDVSADLGGRIIRDKLWFYGSLLRQANSKTVTGYAESPGPDGRYGTSDDVAGFNPISVTNETLKLSYQPKTSYKAIGFIQHNSKNEPQRDGSRFRPLESTYEYTFDPTAWKGEFQATPTDKLLINVIGGYVYYWANRPAHEGAQRAGNPSRTDLATGMFEGPHHLVFFRFRNHWQTSGNVAYFADGARGGKHELKVGYNVDLEHLGIDRPNQASGNYLLTFDNRTPFQITTLNNPIDGKGSKMNNYGVFLQDTWSAGQRLTVNAGVRFERYSSFVDPAVKEQGQFGTAGSFPAVDIVTWDGIAPRIGVAFDLTGDTKTVVKATYGRYNHNPGVDFSEQWNANSLTQTVYRWRDQNGNRDYDSGEVDLSLNGADFVSTSGAASIQLNPDLRQPVTSEFSASAEREVGRDFSVKLVYVHKTQRDLFQNINVRRPYSAYSIPITRPDPGPDGVTGNGDDGGNVTFYDYRPEFRGAAFVSNSPTNRDGDDDRYDTIEITTIKRHSSNFDVVASWSATKNHRNIVTVPQSPNDEINALDTTWSWQAKLTASYMAPYRIQLSGFWQALSGAPGQRTYVYRNVPNLSTVTIRMEEFGAQSLPDLHSVNFRVGKRFSLGRYRIDTAADLFNVFNANTEVGLNYASGPTYGAITGILPPRVLRLGATLSF